MTFSFDKLTVKAQESLQRSQQITGQCQHAEITPLHLLVALLRETDGLVRPLLGAIGVQMEQLLKAVESELQRLPKISGGGAQNVNRELQEVLEAAGQQVVSMNDEFVSTEHLLLSLTQTESKAQSLLKLSAVETKPQKQTCYGIGHGGADCWNQISWGIRR